MRTPFLFILSLSLLSLHVHAGEERYFRYKTANGVTVINDVLPADYATKGYSIINKDGVVIQNVAPELTAQQVVAKEKMDKIRLDKAIKARQQADSDRLLLSTFTTIEDIQLTRDRIIVQLNNTLESLKQNRLDQQKQLDKLHKNAANMERSLGKVSDSIKGNIAGYVEKIAELESLVLKASQRIDTTKLEYQQQIERFVFLTGAKPAPKSTTPAAGTPSS